MRIYHALLKAIADHKRDHAGVPPRRISLNRADHTALLADLAEFLTASHLLPGGDSFEGVPVEKLDDAHTSFVQGRDGHHVLVLPGAEGQYRLHATTEH